MTIASFLLRRRRDLAIGAATVLLHYLVIGWAAGYVGDDAERAPEEERVIMLANIRAPGPKPAAPKPLPPPPPPPAPAKARMARAPVPAPRPTEVPASLEPEALAPALAVVPVEAADLEAPLVVEAPEPAKPLQPSYKVSLPPSADLTLDVARTDANGTKWSGSMAMSFKQGGGQYRMSVEASISLLVARVNLAQLTSEGQVGETGLVPRLSTEKRRGRSQTATHFNAQDGRITFSASERSYELLPGTQDKATVPIQLAGIARADPGQFESGVRFLVGEDRDAKVFNFVVVGQEELDTPMGRLRTWHLSRPPLAGAYNSRLDVWLAPAHHWYPVQIRNTEGSGAVTTQTIRKIVVTDIES